MEYWKRITMNPRVMGGRPCIRGMHVTVSMLVGMLAAGRSEREILAAYPELRTEDLKEALAYAAWRLDKPEPALAHS